MLKIREYEEEDVADIVEIHRAVDSTSDWKKGGPWVCEELCKEHIENVMKYGWKVLVVEIDNRVVGEIELVPGIEPQPYGKNLHISLLYIHPKYQGKGIGKSLVLNAIEIAEEERYDMITVVPSPQSSKFYEKMGFEVMEKWDKLSVNLMGMHANKDIQEIKSKDYSLVQNFPMRIGRYQSSKNVWDFVVRRTFKLMPTAKIYGNENCVCAIVGNTTKTAFCWGKNLDECIKIAKNSSILNGGKKLKILVKGRRGDVKFYSFTKIKK